MVKRKRPNKLSFQEVVSKLQKNKAMPVNSDGHQVTMRTEVNPIQLKPHVNKLNWKGHPERQRKFLESTIAEDGWVSPLIFDANSMKLLDGHGRLQTAIDNGWTSVPIDVGYWSKEAADKLLLTIDTSQRMSSADGSALKSLSEKALNFLDQKKNTLANQISSDLMVDIHSYSDQLLKGKQKNISIGKSKKSLDTILGRKAKAKVKKDKRERPTDNDSMFETYLRTDNIFPSQGNKFGIPDLLPSKLYNNLDVLPVDTFDRSGKSLLSDNYYCHSSRPFDSRNHLKPVGGFLGFYCEDKNFTNVFNQPDKHWEDRFRDEQWHAIIEPDYSAYMDWPFALRLYAVYRSRWLCRWWQELGQEVIPILRRTNDIDADRWMYESLPQGTEIAFMQLRMGGKKTQQDPEYWDNIGRVLVHCQDLIGLKMVLFYAGESFEKYVVGQIPSGLEYKFITPFIDKRRQK